MTEEVKLSVSLLEKISVKHDAGEIVSEFHALYGSENGRELFEHRRQLRAAAVECRHTELMVLVFTDTHCEAPTSTSEGGRTIAKWHRDSFYNEISSFHCPPFPVLVGDNHPGRYNQQTTQPWSSSVTCRHSTTQCDCVSNYPSIVKLLVSYDMDENAEGYDLHLLTFLHYFVINGCFGSHVYSLESQNYH